MGHRAVFLLLPPTSTHHKDCEWGKVKFYGERWRKVLVWAHVDPMAGSPVYLWTHHPGGSQRGGGGGVGGNSHFLLGALFTPIPCPPQSAPKWHRQNMVMNQQHLSYQKNSSIQ